MQDSYVLNFFFFFGKQLYTFYSHQKTVNEELTTSEIFISGIFLFAVMFVVNVSCVNFHVTEKLVFLR